MSRKDDMMTLPANLAECGFEFTMPVPLSEIGGKVVHYQLAADAEQRIALAKRFGLVALDMLTGDVDLCQGDNGIIATGTINASLVQVCVVSGGRVPAVIVESFNVRFIADSDVGFDEEIEVELAECDTLFHDGRIVDLGELVAQTLALAIDPYPRSPNATALLKAAGVKGEDEASNEASVEARDDAGPFAALAALRKKAD